MALCMIAWIVKIFDIVSNVNNHLMKRTPVTTSRFASSKPREEVLPLNF